MTSVGICECGCGEPTKRITRSCAAKGQRIGDYRRFRPGHFSRTSVFRSLNTASYLQTLTQEDSPRWKGGRRKGTNGYIWLNINGQEVLEHRRVAEQILGRPLDDAEVVHHKNHNRTDNRPENLEIFPSHAEHMRSHMAGGEARRIGMSAKTAPQCKGMSRRGGDECRKVTRHESGYCRWCRIRLRATRWPLAAQPTAAEGKLKEGS